MQYKSPVLQNSLQLLQEIRSSLGNNKMEKSQKDNIKQSKKQVFPSVYSQSYVCFEIDSEEPRIQAPECTKVVDINQSNSSQITEEIQELLRTNQKSFDRHCNEIERSIRDLLENFEDQEEDNYSQERKYYHPKPAKRIS